MQVTLDGRVKPAYGERRQKRDRAPYGARSLFTLSLADCLYWLTWPADWAGSAWAGASILSRRLSSLSRHVLRRGRVRRHRHAGLRIGDRNIRRRQQNQRYFRLLDGSRYLTLVFRAFVRLRALVRPTRNLRSAAVARAMLLWMRRRAASRFFPRNVNCAPPPILPPMLVITTSPLR